MLGCLKFSGCCIRVDVIESNEKVEIYYMESSIFILDEQMATTTWKRIMLN